MAMTMRAPSMLPAIKCSNCGNDVEISRMGDHMCGGADQNGGEFMQEHVHEPYQPDTRSAEASRGYGYPQRVDSPQMLSPDMGAGHLKPTRFVPPRIDPYTANRPYAQQKPSASNYTLRTPETPDSPFISCAGPTHNPTTNTHGRRKPGPFDHAGALSSNLDCAFPPFPASPMSSTPRSDASSPGFFNDSAPYSMPTQRKEPQPTTYLQQPMQSAYRKDSAQMRSASPLSQLSQQDKDEAKRDAFFSRKPSVSSSKAPSRNLTTGYQNEYNPYAHINNASARQASPEQNFRAPPPAQSAYSSAAGPSRPSRPGGEVDNFIASLKEDPARSKTPAGTKLDSRSNIFDQEQGYFGLERSPSEPSHNSRSRQLPQRAATASDLRNPYAPPSSDFDYPSRNGNGGDVRLDPRSKNAPPFPSSNPGRSYEHHIPSLSYSSAGSSISARTGRSTPLSDGSSIPDVRSPPRTSPPRPADGRAYGNMVPMSSTPYMPYGEEPRTKASTAPKSYTPDSPILADDFNPYAPPKSNAPAAAGPPRSLPWTTRETAATTKPGLARSGTDSSLNSATSSTNKPRHVCRGCTTPIVGKSIKCADGRLTGRYHRACFGCSTCSAPFVGAEFYVLNDRPYCEQHYHSLNGSLCSGCHRGIEGQYLETEKREKYHTRCLCCSTCRETLGEEYFDVGGRVYCERHAVAEVRRLGGPQQGQGGYGAGGQGMLSANGGGWRAERRKTRLGMFM